MLLFLNASATGALGRLLLVQLRVIVHLVEIGGSAVKLLLEDGLGVRGFEFGLEITNGMAVSAAVGATASVGEVVTIVLHLVSRAAPMTKRELMLDARRT